MAKKRMYKKGSFLEPNKELKFGGLKKKRKYQRGGTSTNEEGARAGTPRAETAAKAKANNSSMDKLKKKMQAGGLKEPKPEQTGLKKLPTAVRNKMGYKMFGGYKKK